MPAIAAALGSAGAAIGDVARIVAGGGPGSFTSLRIGAALAKGLAVARGIPLAAMPSLSLLVAGTDSPSGDGRYLAILDAMRGDVYAAVIESSHGTVVRATRARLAPRSAVAARAKEQDARIFGAGEAIDAAPHARGLARLDPSLVHEVSLASWEPDYGRLAEAQVKWETEHGRSLTTG